MPVTRLQNPSRPDGKGELEPAWVKNRMLYNLTHWDHQFSALRLFHYITFRSAGAAVTALLLSLWLGPKVIAWLTELSFGQNYRDRAEVAGNLTGREPRKMGTPTMGGLLIVLTLNVTTLLWAQWKSLVLLTVLSVAVLAVLGFYDDYTKIARASSGGGAKSRVKLWVQTGLALFIGLYLWQSARHAPVTSGQRHHGSLLQGVRSPPASVWSAWCSSS